MTKLLVPIALNSEGILTTIENTIERHKYRCPACYEFLILKKGNIKKHHFAHRNSIDCNQETITHITAKLLVQKAISDWRMNNGIRPMIQRKCNGCGKIVIQPLPEKVDAATLEKKIPGGFIADIGIESKGTTIACIEIKVTHAVDNYKINEMPVPFIEINGDDAIENPLYLKPITDKFRSVTCNICKTKISYFQEVVNTIAKRIDIELPTYGYRYAPDKCWKCGKDIILFKWPSHLNDDNLDLDLGPRPKTIEYRYSNTAKYHYWGNTCPYCNRLQGNYFRDHHHFENALHHVEDLINFDSQESFDRDMRKIAISYYNLCFYDNLYGP